MELSTSHGTVGDHGIRGGCPLKACPVRKYGIRMGKRKSRRKTRAKSFRCWLWNRNSKGVKILVSFLTLFWKPASSDVGYSLLRRITEIRIPVHSRIKMQRQNRQHLWAVRWWVSKERTVISSTKSLRSITPPITNEMDEACWKKKT